MLVRERIHKSGHAFIRAVAIVALFGMPSGPSPVVAQEEESQRVWQL